MTPRTPSAIAVVLTRTLLRLTRVGDRRDDIEADVLELFEKRRGERGAGHAYARLVADIASVARPRARSAPALARSDRPAQFLGLSSSLTDLRYGLRLFRKHPAVIGGTIGGLSLAIAVGVTVFTIVNAGVTRPYGMADPHAVVRVQMFASDRSSMMTVWPYRAFLDLRDRATHAHVEAFLRDGTSLSTSASDTTNRRDSLLIVSGGYLPTLGARAILGRTLQPADDAEGAAPVAVLNHHVWTVRFHGDPQIVGKTVWLTGTPVTIVGVLDPSFTGPVDNPPTVWAPFGSWAAIQRDRPLERTSDQTVSVIARLDTNVDRAAAATELSAIAATLPDLGLQIDRTRTPAPTVGVRLDGASSPIDGPDAPEMWAVVGVTFALVGLVIALACANVANLLLASAATRAREIGLRLALGASRGRIVRQLLGESLAIGLVAGAGGLLLSIWLVPVVASATGMPDTFDLRPDGMVLLFTTAIAVLSGVGAGLTPARHAASGDLIGVLKSDGAQTGAPPKAMRLRRWFIGFQAAASMLLLVAAGLFLRAALHITHVDLGFDADRLAWVALSTPRNDQRTASRAFWVDALERVRAVPSVEASALVLYPPFSGAISISTFARSAGAYAVYSNSTDAGYFDAAGFRIVRGRAYTADEVRDGASVAVVSETIVRDFLGGAEPIGATLKPVSDALAQVRVVGVVAESLTARVHYQGNGTIYRPLLTKDLQAARLLVRARQPASIVRDVEHTLTVLDPDVRPQTTLVGDDVERAMNEPKLLANLSGAVALLALTLAALGLYGVTTFVVRQRMFELHIRQAIGASASDIVRLLVRQSLSPVVIGLTVGLATALAAAKVLTPALSGISPHDPPAIAAAVVVLLIVAMSAVISPALRASRADAAAGLRQG